MALAPSVPSDPMPVMTTASVCGPNVRATERKRTSTAGRQECSGSLVQAEANRVTVAKDCHVVVTRSDPDVTRIEFDTGLPLLHEHRSARTQMLRQQPRKQGRHVLDDYDWNREIGRQLWNHFPQSIRTAGATRRMDLPEFYSVFRHDNSLIARVKVPDPGPDLYPPIPNRTHDISMLCDVQAVEQRSKRWCRRPAYSTPEN